MNEMMIFEHEEFGKVRTVEKDGEPWLVGKDVAAALGYLKPENAIATHIDDEDKTTTLIQGTGSNYKSKAVIINESGLYSLVLSSKLPNAKKFKRWVTSEVLPSIRKHGLYATEATIETMLDNPDTAIRLLQEIKAERERRKQLESKVEMDRPKVEFAEAIQNAEGTITVEKFSKLLYDKHGIKIGRNKMFKLLRSNGYLQDNNVPYQKYVERGYFTTCEVLKYGKPYVVTLVTGKGQLALFKKIVDGMIVA